MDELLLGYHTVLVGVHGGEHPLRLLHLAEVGSAASTAKQGKDGVSYLKENIINDLTIQRGGTSHHTGVYFTFIYTWVYETGSLKRFEWKKVQLKVNLNIFKKYQFKNKLVHLLWLAT